jgi:hypothetical protein
MSSILTATAALSYCVIDLSTETMGLSLTALIPNHSLIIILILTLKEISLDLQESSGRKYVNSIQSISLPSETIHGVKIKFSARIDIA